MEIYFENYKPNEIIICENSKIKYEDTVQSIMDEISTFIIDPNCENDKNFYSL